MQERNNTQAYQLKGSMIALRLVFGVLATGTMGMQVYAAEPSAISSKQQYNIPAGPLDKALASFAGRSGVNLSLDPALTSGLQSEGLQGSYGLKDGFSRLLTGSGLEAVVDDNANWKLRKATTLNSPASNTKSSATLPEVGVVAARSRESKAMTEGSQSYAARAVTIGKGEQSLRDVPQSVSVVTRQRMDEQNLTSLDSVLTQTTGVTREFRNYGHSVYYSRGFEISSFMTDGVPMGYYGGLGIAPDTAIFDRVEVLRGAPGLLIGNGDPGGTVNFVRKRPLAEKQVQLTARAGSWDYYRLDGDITGPINESGTLRGRLVAGYEDRHYSYDEAKTRLPLFYGILEADLGEHTVAAAGIRYQHFKQDGGRWAGGLPVTTDGSHIKLPRSTAFGPSWTWFESEVKEVFGDVTHHFNDDWSVKVSGTYQSSNRQDATMMTNGNVNPATLSGFELTGIAFEDTQYRRKGVDAQVQGKFDAWGQQHTLFVGANWQKSTVPSSKSAESLYSTPVAVNLNAINLSALPRLYRGAYSNYSDQETTQGIYGNLKLQLLEPLKVILGGRVSWYDFNNSGGSAYKQTHEVTPYAAVIWRLNEQWSLYGSYTDIFRPQSQSFTASGNPLKPAMGSNYEAGIKGELNDGKLNTSFSVFRIVMDDLAQIDPNNPTICPGAPVSGGCSINGGKVKSQGFDAEINGEILPRVQLFTGYTYNATKTVRDRDANGIPTLDEGRPYNSAFNPRHLLRSWATYRLPGSLDKVTLGGGVTIQSELSADTYWGEDIPRRQGGYSVWNVHASYRVDEHWTASLNINNLFDRRYYTNAAGMWYGEPQSAMLTVRGTF
ncbi:TonB-dependent receptor [Methylobacillus gramineus]|uniref:TonB-dependent siderophore receptor n=1 Tax=Methylobacillus gramineus TaxID=755169 RepID=UPI001CFF7DFD|nr:TonB-dependent receptor [Methylobacillus gramineus]MCB5185755.1 TonB-dependent receptor [Methylobacillus gramineus]